MNMQITKRYIYCRSTYTDFFFFFLEKMENSVVVPVTNKVVSVSPHSPNNVSSFDLGGSGSLTLLISRVLTPCKSI